MYWLLYSRTDQAAEHGQLPMWSRSKAHACGKTLGWVMGIVAVIKHLLACDIRPCLLYVIFSVIILTLRFFHDHYICLFLMSSSW